MKNFMTDVWLAQRLAEDDQSDIEGGDFFLPGRSSSVLELLGSSAGNVESPQQTGTREAAQMTNILRSALGRLVLTIRKRENKSRETLARELLFSVDELTRLEDDVTYRCVPRVASTLAHWTKIPISEMSQLAGLSTGVEPSLVKAAVRFAASSAPSDQLTQDDLAALRMFVESVVNKHST